MAFAGQKTIERMTGGLTEYQLRAFACLIRDVREGAPLETCLERVKQCRNVTGNLEDVEVREDPDFRAQLEKLEFSALKTFATENGVSLEGLKSRKEITDAIVKAANAQT